MISHGTWKPAPAKLAGYQFWENDDGMCWYDYQDMLPQEGALFLLIVDGKVEMIEPHASRIVPHKGGEVIEVPADTQVARGDEWRPPEGEQP